MRSRFALRPAAVLIALLQRSPVIRFACEALGGGGSLFAASAWIRPAAMTAAALGALDTVAGASVSITTSAKAPLNLTAGQQMTPVAFSLTQRLDFPESWQLVGGLPPGLTFGDASGTPVLTAPGTFNSNLSSPETGVAALTGTPTVGGTYTLQLIAYEYPNGASNHENNGNTSPLYSLTINVAGGSVTPVSITSQPVSETVASGTTVVFNMAASSSAALSYQWSVNGQPISGATSPRLVVSGATAANAGNYTCTASNASGGSATTNAATLGFTSTTTPGHLVNLSVLTTMGTGQPLTVGMVVGGPASSQQETVLVRAVGPALSAFGLPTPPLSDASFTLNETSPQQAVIATNNGWSSPQSNMNVVQSADAATGAFALTPGSLDSATVVSLAQGNYTSVVSGNGGSGSVLAEFYDDTGTYNTSLPRLVNVSTTTPVAVGGSLTAGFVLGGSSAKTVLVRAVGPTLGSFGVGNVMADPKITLYQGQTAIASNFGWGGDPQLLQIMSQVGAFPLPAGSLDSALLATLSPGSYTATAQSASGGGGNVLVEVYEVP